MTEAESSVILSAAEILTGEDSQSKEEIISGFFSGEGELEGVPCKDICFQIQGSTLIRATTPDSKLIEIAQAVAHPHQRPSEEDVTEGAVYDFASGADTTGHSHTGGLLFVHESELDNETDVPTVRDVPPPDETASYEVATMPEQQPVEVPEPVCMFVYP